MINSFYAFHALNSTTTLNSHWPGTLWTSECRICHGQSGDGTDYSLGISVFSCLYHSANAPYSYFIHLPLISYYQS